MEQRLSFVTLAVRDVDRSRSFYVDALGWSPELDVPGLVTRIRVYQNAGYFEPSEMNDLIARLTPAVVTEPGRLLANFAALYG